MAEVTGFTAARMLEIEDGTVVSGEINGSGHLILTTHGGDDIDAGYALVAVPDASTTVKGVSELATQAEVEAHTDTVRATTPSSLASTIARITALEAIPGDKVQLISPPAESDSYSSYPTGVSLTTVGTGSGWSVNSGFGTILTVQEGSNRTVQILYSIAGGTQIPATWFRTYHSSGGGGGWTAWQQVATPADPTSMGIIGEIKMWPLVSPPTGWQVCDGSAINRTTYPKLFALIGTTYGVGNGSTTFNVPNMKGRVPVGYDSGQTEFDAIGETGGAKTHTLTSAQIPAHVHPASSGGFTLGGTSGAYAIQGGATYGFGFDANTAANTGGGGAHNILQPYFTTQYIIKLG